MWNGRTHPHPARSCLLPVAVAAGCLLVAPSAPAQRLPEPAQNAIAGARVFGAKGCVECHAVRGLGGRVGPDLGRIQERRSFHELAATMWNHLPRMAARMRERGIERPRLGAREAGDLLAFLYTIDYFDAPGDVERGRRLFVEKRCVMCHQAQGVGGVVGPNLDFLGRYASPIPVAAAMWNHGPAMAGEMRARGIERPTFAGSELFDLIAFLESGSATPSAEATHALPGRAAVGRDLFSSKGCDRCHGPGGRGGAVGPALAGRGSPQGLAGFAAAMWNKAPRMTAAMRRRGIAVPELSAGEMADIVAYLYSVRYFAEAGRPDRGRRVLETRGCVGCHGAGGDGPELGPRFDGPAEVVAALWNHVEVDRRGGEWPALSAAEMADLIAFLTGPDR